MARLQLHWTPNRIGRGFVTKRSDSRPARPQSKRKPSTIGRRTAHTTVPRQLPPASRRVPKLEQHRVVPKLAIHSPRTSHPPKRQVASVLDDAESSLVDVIDNLLAKGVMLNADLILALANVDLVYVRLSALLCAADRVLPTFAKGSVGKPPFPKERNPRRG
jgi:hypothetical protein